MFWKCILISMISLVYLLILNIMHTVTSAHYFPLAVPVLATAYYKIQLKLNLFSRIIWDKI